MGGRLKRAFKYSELALLLGSQKVLPKALGKEALSRAYRKKLTELRGVPLKVSQMLSMSSSEGSGYGEAIAKLEPQPLSLWAERLRQESELLGKIDGISDEGLPASLGQVHRVLMKDGREMALKLQYPDIGAEMKLDQTLLAVVQSHFKSFKQGQFEMPDYQEVLLQELEGEMDYLREVERQKQVYRLFEDDDDIVIPVVEERSCHRDMILMGWEASMAYDEFKAVATRKQVIKAMKLLAQFYFKMLFEGHVIHADPNPGNLGFRCTDDGGVQLIVYDYGSVLDFPTDKGLVLLKIMGFVDAAQGDLFPWFGRLGFNLDTLKPLRSQLMAFADMIMEPFLFSGRYTLEHWNRKERAKSILGENRWNFMVSAPAQLVFFMRSLQTLFFYGSRLGIGVDLRPHVEKYWYEFKTELEELEHGQLEVEEIDEHLAQYLVLHVSEAGETKVHMSLPRSSVERLDGLIDQDLALKLAQQQVDLDELLERTRRNGYRPGELFSCDDGHKKVKVYLE
jgi:hypothetical protein